MPSFGYFSARLYIDGWEPSGTSQGRERSSLKLRWYSPAMSGTSLLFTRIEAGIHADAADDDDVVGLAVFLRLGGPGGAAARVAGREMSDQRCAAERSLGRHRGESGRADAACLAGWIFMSAGTSSAMAMTCAPVSSFTRASPSMWSACAWLPSRILMSVNLNPSCSTEDRITGTVASKQLLIRMFPCGVTNRNDASDSEPT